MSQADHIDIIKQCLSLDVTAFGFYKKLCEISGDEKLKIFFRKMMGQEKQHVAFWKHLLDYAKNHKLPPVFDHPLQIKDELSQIQLKVKSIVKDSLEELDVSARFLLIYQIEFYLMHPAFEALFHFMKKETGDASPEEGYASHIDGIIEALHKFGQTKPEFEIIAQMMERMWALNHQLALRLFDIKALRDLIPICMHCKKVRNDEGYWTQVESYIGDHFHTDFSHGICPDCMKIYYSEYEEEDNEKNTG